MMRMISLIMMMVVMTMLGLVMMVPGLEQGRRVPLVALEQPLPPAEWKCRLHTPAPPENTAKCTPNKYKMHTKQIHKMHTKQIRKMHAKQIQNVQNAHQTNNAKSTLKK